MGHNPRLISYVVTGIVVLVVLAFRLQRMRRAQRLRLETLWVVPVVIAALAAFVLTKAPPAPADLPWLALGLLAGGGLGYMRGRMIAISVEPETSVLNVQASPFAIVFLVALLIARYALRAALIGASASLHISVPAITDTFILLAAGLLTVQRAEMGLRAARLMADARRGGQG